MEEQIPQPYQDFAADFPSVARAYERFGSATHRAGPLDERARRLAKLAIAVGGRLEGAVRSHARRAREAGITAAEMDHVVLLAATTVGLPSAVAARAWIRDELGITPAKLGPAAKPNAGDAGRARGRRPSTSPVGPQRPARPSGGRRGSARR
ncbi:MAG TPA: carboxymuconolactone decarboxylase family protein [Dehalococcoidia bacterium]|nr:carboxymuconolactone decarboxylase family protein [Dehalococcoidia bacterium]